MDDDRQAAKQVVLAYFDALERASIDSIPDVLKAHTVSDYRFRAVHPLNEIEGADAVAATVWQPLRAALRPMQRRQHVFMAGPNVLDGTMWVTSMGQLLGLFDAPWLGIRPTGRMALVPYCEFHRIDDGRIAESALWVDIISVMRQSGYNPFGEQTGADVINPGPRTSDGLMFDAQDEADSRRTLELILRMCNELVDDGMRSGSDRLSNTWHDDMLWFGPSGIGATYTIPRYQKQHQGPFRAGLRNIDFKGHVLEHAEGHYGGWFGWPNMRMQQGDGFLGLPASETVTEMRVVDIYRRDGDKLAENWIFIDFLHYLRILGVDILARYTDIHSY